MWRALYLIKFIQTKMPIPKFPVLFVSDTGTKKLMARILILQLVQTQDVALRTIGSYPHPRQNPDRSLAGLRVRARHRHWKAGP